MGLAGGIVRKVFSKSPCSSAGTGSRGHSKGSAADHRRRWSSLRLYLCGEEMNAAAEEDDDDGETVSVKSFETCCVMPPEEAHVVPVVVHRRQMTSDALDAMANDIPGEPAEDQGSRVPGHTGQSHGHVVVVVARDEEEGAATMIQSAFRAFMARRQLQELRARQEQEETDGAQDQEPTRSPTAASVATSVLVQVGEESLSNIRLTSAEDSASVQQQQQRSSQQRSSSTRPPPAPAPPAFRVKEEWDDSTVSSNVSRMRIQSRIEATTRRERALAYAFSQQLRSCGGASGGGSKKRSSARAEREGGEFNVGWSWLERWMATRQADQPAASADDCMSRNADTGSVATVAGRHRRVVVVRRRSSDLAGEEKESCGSNDVVSVVSFDGSSSLGGGAGGARSGLSGCHKPPGGSKNRLKGGGRSLPRRKQVAASEHRFQARSHKVSKKGHQRVEQETPHRDRLDAGGFVDDAYQPPTDY